MGNTAMNESVCSTATLSEEFLKEYLQDIALESGADRKSSPSEAWATRIGWSKEKV